LGTLIKTLPLVIPGLPFQLKNFIYRRPTLYLLEIAVDFLKSLEIAVVWGGGVVLLGYKVIYYIPIDDGMKQVLGRAGGI
jgi:hypothetical protein